MTRRRALLPVFTVAGAALVTACGTQSIQLGSKQQQLQSQNPGEAAQVRHGATLFRQRCSGCHTLQAAGTQGSATEPPSAAHQRAQLQRSQEQYEQVALRDPQRRVLRRDHAAEHRGRRGRGRRATFLAEYAGKDGQGPSGPRRRASRGLRTTGGHQCRAAPHVLDLKQCARPRRRARGAGPPRRRRGRWTRSSSWTPAGAS